MTQLPQPRAMQLAWILTAAVGAVVLAASVIGGFRIAWGTFAVAAAATAVLAAIAWVYRTWRPDARIAAATESTALLISFAGVGAPFSYVLTAANLPLQDASLHAADHLLGFDWRMVLQFFNDHPVAANILSIAYQTFSLQATVTVLALAFCARFERLAIFMLSFMMSAIACIVISAVVPATGAWTFYGIGPQDHAAIAPVTQDTHLAVYSGLRSGSVRELVGSTAQGILTFPSFHAALGVVFIFALWGVPYLRWIGLVLNVGMILATPVEGSHYLTDVLAGLAVAVWCLTAATWLVRRLQMSPVHSPAFAVQIPRVAVKD